MHVSEERALIATATEEEIELASLLMAAAFHDDGQRQRLNGELGPIYIRQAIALMRDPRRAAAIIAFLPTRRAHHA